MKRTLAAALAVAAITITAVAGQAANPMVGGAPKVRGGLASCVIR